MEHDSNFDVDAVLAVLGTVSEKYPVGSREDEALRVAAVALVYLRGGQKVEEYREFFRRFHTPAAEAITVAHTFATRADADAWLVSGEAREEVLVRIEGQGFRVIGGRKGLRFLRTPLPEEMDTPD
jgi:hypothetical protein